MFFTETIKKISVTLQKSLEKSESKFSNKYDKLIIEAFGGTDEKENKIIKKISKEVIIDK